MAVNKVVINDEIKIDLTSDTVSPDTLSKGITAHDKSGNVIVGQAVSGGISLGGQSSRKYCGSNQIKTGDFVSSYVFPSSNITSGEFNFPAARVMAACHYKDDIYIFAFYNYQSQSSVSSSLPFAFKVLIQAMKLNGGSIVNAGPAYQIYDSVTHRISYPYKNGKSSVLYYIDNTFQYQSILQLHNNHIVFCNGTLMVFNLDENTLAFGLNYSASTDMKYYHLRDNYYYYLYSSQKPTGALYYRLTQILKINDDGSIEYGTQYREDGRYQSDVVSVTPSCAMHLVKSFDDGTELFCCWGKQGTNRAYIIADLNTLSVKDSYIYYDEGYIANLYSCFSLNGDYYYKYNIKFYKVTYTDSSTSKTESVTSDVFQSLAKEALIEYNGYLDSYFENYIYTGSSTEDGYVGTRQVDKNGLVINDWKNQSFAIIDKKVLFRVESPDSDPWTTGAETYHYNGEGYDIGVLPYDSSIGIYGIAVSDSANEFVNIKTPKEV